VRDDPTGLQGRRVTVLIPVGTLEGAKSRLGAVLDAEERDELVRRLATMTIKASVATAEVDVTIVVTPDDAVRAIADDAGARPLRQRSRGLNAGLREAREEALAAGADAILILPIDLPDITSAAIATIVAGLDDIPEPVVGIVPDRHGRGTNALYLAPPDVIDVHFGGDSRAAHAAAGDAVGARVVELGGPLTMDLDTADDLLLAEVAHPERSRG
jgi:2-phospho-L-lactate guanylyltransferase